jgi:hypothetical protein
VPLAHKHTVFELLLLFTVCLSSCYCSNYCISFCLYYFCFIMKKSPPWRVPPPPPLVNLQLAMQFLIMIKGDVSYFKSQGNCEHGQQFTLLLFFYPILSIFHPLKTCYIAKKVSAEQNAGHVQLCYYFIWQVMTCLINVVIDNGCLSMCCSLEAANCTT